MIVVGLTCAGCIYLYMSVFVGIDNVNRSLSIILIYGDIPIKKNLSCFIVGWSHILKKRKKCYFFLVYGNHVLRS